MSKRTKRASNLVFTSLRDWEREFLPESHRRIAKIRENSSPAAVGASLASAAVQSIQDLCINYSGRK